MEPDLAILYSCFEYNICRPSSEMNNLLPSGVITIHQTNLKSDSVLLSLLWPIFKSHYTNPAYYQIK